MKIILAGLAVPGSSWAADPRRTPPAALWHSQFSLGPDILGKAAFHSYNRAELRLSLTSGEKYFFIGNSS